jgi:hypothetical protein
LIIVDLADEQINLNELIIHKQENLIILLLVCLSLLLIHILYFIAELLTFTDLRIQLLKL